MMKDLVVIGGGHAGCEAALAGARMGLDTLLLTLNMDGIALMACNPVIGGSAKGHLVRELDAMGGEMGRAIDDTFLQSRMLNMSKGPAVHALRAQADKQQYQNRMRTALMTQDNLTVRQGEVAAMDDGEQSLVGSGGVRLSGGQGKRLALARTLAHPRPVMVLDDPFSALDRGTEDTVFANLQAYSKDKVVFLISHRL